MRILGPTLPLKASTENPKFAYYMDEIMAPTLVGFFVCGVMGRFGDEI